MLWWLLWERSTRGFFRYVLTYAQVFQGCSDDEHGYSLQTSSGKNLKLQEKSNMTVSGACLLTTSMVLKFILQMQISKMSVSFHLSLVDNLDHWLLFFYYRLVVNQQVAALPPFSWNLLRKVSRLRMVKNLLWNGLISTLLEVWKWESFVLFWKLFTDSFIYLTGY